MLIRIISIVVVLFWLGSMGWLCAVIWAPPESRMAEVDPREIYEVFFGWNETTNMTLLENGMRRGQLSVAGGSGTDPGTGEYENLLSVSAVLENYDKGIREREVEAFVRVAMDFSREIELLRSELSGRIPSRHLSARVSMEGDPPKLDIRASIRDQDILNLKGIDASNLPKMPENLVPMGSFLGNASLNLADIDWQIEARMGSFTFGGRDQRAYLLILRLPKHDQSIRVYFSEVGEPLKIESGLGFEAISEILVPLDAYPTRKADD